MVRLPKQEDLVQMIIEEGIIDLRLLQALREVPRARFVPPDFEGQAYLDEPLPIPHGQVTTQPSLIAKMVEALGLKGSEKVLEIGTGYGFQTALLARLAAFVWSIELWDDIAETARTHLSRQGIANAEVVVGDGSEGLAQQAPFDAIIVSAAFPETPKPLIEQLAPSGRLIQPIGSGGDEAIILFEKRKESLIPRRTITRARFVRLYGKHGFPQGPEV